MEAVKIALALLKLAIEIWPELRGWFDSITSGKHDEISIRVRDVLGSESETAKALREIG